jgi:BirA family transcriptional regulator, biotin operon repressor / biotin---[acetyl-CoA-carboxylase] ligase
MENIKSIGKVCYRFDELPSTNDYARQIIAMGNPANGTAVLAAIQSAGRGQYGREWLTEPNTALTVSFILFPKQLQTDKLFLLGQMTALAVHDIISKWIDPAFVRIKWPNDVYLKEKKVAGILIENSLSSDGAIAYSIIGIGINVAQKTFPPHLNQATSLNLHVITQLDVETVFESLCTSLQKWYDALCAQNFAFINERYRSVQYGLGERFHFQEVHLSEPPFEAIISGIDPQNNLVLTHPDGRKSSWPHGSIRLVL